MGCNRELSKARIVKQNSCLSFGVALGLQHRGGGVSHYSTVT